MPIIIQVKGGLGNQMFQYALAVAMEKQGKEVLLDVSPYSRKNIHQGYQLEEIFSLNAQYAPISLVKKYLKKKKLSEKLGKYTFVRPLIKYYRQNIEGDFEYSRNKFIYSLSDAYLVGVWQSEKFFLSARDIVKKIYNFNIMDISKKNQELLEKIMMTESISIHVRRGDYVDSSRHGNICTLDYYEKAVDIMKTLEKAHFYVFSNDINWCKENIRIEKPTSYIDWNEGMNSHNDMYLMSQCKHNIIANSSFSWWAAYLNTNANKIVTAPSRWFNSDLINYKDLYQKDWLRIEC